MRDDRGCNVTAPFKEGKNHKFANRLTERAEFQRDTVNALKKLDDGEIIGDNTDGEV